MSADLNWVSASRNKDPQQVTYVKRKEALMSHSEWNMVNTHPGATTPTLVILFLQLWCLEF